MSYSVFYEQSVQKDVSIIPASVLKALRHAIEKRLTTHPIKYGKPLRYALKGHRRIRVGDYRIIYRVNEQAKTVYIVAMGLRRDIYGD